MNTIFVLLALWGFPPCMSEDQETTCYWDAQAQGNGAGHSFVVWKGEVYYIN